MAKEFYTELRVREVSDHSLVPTPNAGLLALYSYDDNYWIKDGSGIMKRILTTEDIVLVSHAISANTSIDIVPAKYKIKSIIANGSVNNLKIGTSLNGYDVVNNFNISGIEDVPFGKSIFSLSSSQRLYFSGSSWISTVFFFKMEKVA